MNPSYTDSFSARLPEQCSAICRKLGGPLVVSPLRPKLMASATLPAASSRPGGVTKRPIPSKARRSLRRVITDERHAREGSRGASGAISLMRSATTPTIPGLKRERSETPLLSSIPSAESQSMLVNRGGVLKSKNFSQREVDLGNLATINDAKVKKTSIEAELKDAISALKKPNRQLAGQLQVEAERRAASVPTHSRSRSGSSLLWVLILIFTESKKPVRNPSFQGVQILSTPKGNRRKDLGIEKCPTLGLDLEQIHGLDVIPPSSLPRVPLPVPRALSTRVSEKRLFCEATPVRPGNNINPAFLGTPSRAQTKSPPRLLGMFLGAGTQNLGGLPTSPLQARRYGRQQFLDIPISFSQAVECSPSKVVAVHATPIKQGKLNFTEVDACSKPPDITIEGASMVETENVGKSNVPPGGEDDSIYKSLGWDDYDELT